jgi:transmembrane sensor
VTQEPARPFRVSSPTALVQVVGTQFNIRNRPGDTLVSVLEGRVKVSAQNSARAPFAGTAELVGAGQEASVAGDGRIVRRTPADISRAVAWRERRLVFHEARLEEVVAEINRYSMRRFFIEGEIARETRLTATFDVDDPESLANFLERYSRLSVQRRGEHFAISERSH